MSMVLVLVLAACSQNQPPEVNTKDYTCPSSHPIKVWERRTPVGYGLAGPGDLTGGIADASGVRVSEYALYARPKDPGYSLVPATRCAKSEDEARETGAKPDFLLAPFTSERWQQDFQLNSASTALCFFQAQEFLSLVRAHPSAIGNLETWAGSNILDTALGAFRTTLEKLPVSPTEGKIALSQTSPEEYKRLSFIESEVIGSACAGTLVPSAANPLSPSPSPLAKAAIRFLGRKSEWLPDIGTIVTSDPWSLAPPGADRASPPELTCGTPTVLREVTVATTTFVFGASAPTFLREFVITFPGKQAATDYVTSVRTQARRCGSFPTEDGLATVTALPDPHYNMNPSGVSAGYHVDFERAPARDVLLAQSEGPLGENRVLVMVFDVQVPLSDPPEHILGNAFFQFSPPH